MNPLLEKTRDLLRNADFSWAVCGGFALELFLDRQTRVHDDIDICVFEEDRERIVRYMLRENWDVYEFRGQGKVRPIADPAASESGRNLMLLREKCELVKFYPCDNGDLYHQFFHTGVRDLNYLDFLFNTVIDKWFLTNGEWNIEREVSGAILHREGIPYLAPEIVLLYKSARWADEKNRLDYAQAYSRLSQEQKAWLHNSLQVCYPQGHPWLGPCSGNR